MPPLTTGGDWEDVPDRDNTASEVWADTRLIALPETRRCWNDAGFVSRIRR